MPNVTEECRHDEATTDEWYRRESLPDWGLKKKLRGMLFAEYLHFSPLTPDFGEWKVARRYRCHDVDEVERLFERLAEKWREETLHVSSTTQLVTNSNYQQIIGMGRPALPMILRELEHSAGHWFWALASITRENPVDKRDAGNIKQMRASWVRWGKERGLLR
jgi:hypothetical protein